MTVLLRPLRVLPSTDRCWESGTGKQRRNWRLYKRLWEAATGRTVPEGYNLHHTCDNDWCFNPWHLRCIPLRDHHVHHAAERDLAAENRARHAGDTHCSRNHEWAVYGRSHMVTRRGRRVPERYCAACQAEWKQERRARARQK